MVPAKPSIVDNLLARSLSTVIAGLVMDAQPVSVRGMPRVERLLASASIEVACSDSDDWASAVVSSDAADRGVAAPGRRVVLVGRDAQATTAVALDLGLADIRQERAGRTVIVTGVVPDWAVDLS